MLKLHIWVVIKASRLFLFFVFCCCFESATQDGSTHLLNFDIGRVQTMSEEGDAFLHVHLDHMQPKSRSRDYAMTCSSRSAILVAKFKIQLQKSELTVKMRGKCSFQDCWLKGECIPEVGSER